MYKMDLALNNLQWLICHKTKSKQTKRYEIISVYVVSPYDNFATRPVPDNLSLARSLSFNNRHRIPTLRNHTDAVQDCLIQ